MPRVHPPGGRLARAAVVFVAAAATATAAVPATAAALPAAHPAAHPAALPAALLPSATPARTPLDAPAAAHAAARPAAQRQGVVPGEVIVGLAAGTSVTGGTLPGTRLAARTPHTSSPALDATLHAVGATSLRPAVRGAQADLARTYVVRTTARDSAAVARALQGTPGVAFAEPDRYVNTMNSGAVPLPSTAPLIEGHPARPSAAAPGAGGPAGSAPAGSALPTNDAFASSAQALLNAGGVDAAGAFALLGGRYGQQPGAGETITNVSVGDLTDQSMADAGDAYVRSHGPTTVLRDGRRYLDLPSMPLIPAYVAKDGGGLDGAASTEDQDPALDEVLLDFSVMAPLPHDRQRPGATGSGYTDLLGIAPGADYRLVVPEQPTTDRIAGALLAAAHQTPRPDVITASLGFGTDAEGFPGRYLEDDPAIRATVAAIVREGVVVVISSNDGTRLYTTAAVGPDGGSTPTDLALDDRGATAIDDDAQSTVPSRVPDSGAIAAGGTTLDDTLAQGTAGPATTAETRVSGFGTFSSGFGSRVDLSAPSDNILALSHASGGGARDVDVTLNGGTSASAPEIAAAAAVVLQAGRLGGHRLTPGQVRQLLERTGRQVATPPQIDRTLHVGPQIDVTAAAQQALGHATGGTDVVRLSVAHRVTIGDLGGAFLESTDQNRIDLGDRAQGGNGEGLTGPVTFAGDVTGAPANATYSLTVGSTVFRSTTPAIRVTPAQLLSAAGLPVTATADRQVTVVYRVAAGGRTLASATRTLTVGPSDGGHAEATAPQAPAAVAAGSAVTVSYDLTGVTPASAPQLVLSTVGHWNPLLSPLFTAAWHQPLTAAKGTVTIPADAFDGGGLYGIGIAQANFGGNPLRVVYGEFAPIRVVGATADDRPVTPLLGGADGVAGHFAGITRAAPRFTLDYDVRAVHGARRAEVEFSAPAPTLHNSLNTFSNPNGTGLDDDGVDTPSVLHRVLAGTAGHLRLDALQLGLTGSDSYNVRVLALDGSGHVTGQASPLSTLAFDDGLAPDGAAVHGFAAAGGHSVAALDLPGGGSQVRHYATATGHYGAVITADAADGSSYDVVGATADRTLLAHRTAGGDLRVETWDTGRDTLLGATTVAAADGTFVTGRVDAAHARGALLLRAADGGDEVLPVDLSTGTAGAPLPADPAGVKPGSYALMAFDTDTGDLFLAKQAGGFTCLGSVVLARVDLAARTVTGDGSTSGCSHGIGSDGAGTLYNLSATQISVNAVPAAVLGPIDEATGAAAGDGTTLRVGVPSALAVDGVHKVAVVSYAYPEGTPYFGSGVWVPDNNAGGRMNVVDLTTGKVLATLPGFVIGGHGGSENAVQLDPATRTGWTFGANDAPIQQFSY